MTTVPEDQVAADAVLTLVQAGLLHRSHAHRAMRALGLDPVDLSAAWDRFQRRGGLPRLPQRHRPDRSPAPAPSPEPTAPTKRERPNRQTTVNQEDLMASLLNTVRELVSQGVEPERAVAQALRGASRADLDDTVKPLLLSDAQNLHRSMVRDLEKKAFPLPNEEPAAPDVQAEARAALLGEGFSISGRWVLWSQATAEEHRARAQYLRSMAASTLDTAKRHEQAADDIEAAGVTCLAEINEYQGEAAA